MLFHLAAVSLLLLAPLSLHRGPGGRSLTAECAKDDDFAEFEEDDSEEFDFGVSDEGLDEDGECFDAPLVCTVCGGCPLPDAVGGADGMEAGQDEEEDEDDEGEFDDVDGPLVRTEKE